MAQPGDAISVSLEGVQVYKRAVATRRAEFPVPAEVARTGGPAGGASQDFRAELVRAAGQLAVTIDTIARELSVLEHDMEAAASEFVEVDGMVAKEVNSLEWMLSSADKATDSDAPLPSSAPPVTASNPSESDGDSDANSGLG